MTSGDRSSERGWHSILWTSTTDRGRTSPSPSVWVHVCAHCSFFLFSSGSALCDLFPKISPGCRSYSPDICEKVETALRIVARSDNSTWDDVVISHSWIYGVSLKKEICMISAAEGKYCKSSSFVFVVVCNPTIKDTRISSRDLISKQHSSRLRTFQLVKTWLKSRLGSSNHCWRGRRGMVGVECGRWLWQTKKDEVSPLFTSSALKPLPWLSVRWQDTKQTTSGPNSFRHGCTCWVWLATVVCRTQCCDLSVVVCLSFEGIKRDPGNPLS